jgi:ATP-binding cassette subfamily B protein
MTPVFRNDLMLRSLVLVQRHPYSYFQAYFGGAIATRVGEMVDAAQILINTAIYRLLAHFLAFIVACYTIGKVVHPHLCWILVAYSLIFMYAGYRLTKKPYVLAKKYLEAYAILMGQFIDSIHNILPVILFGRHAYERKYIAKQAKIEATASQALQGALLINQALASSFLALLIISLVVYLVYLRRWGLVTVGDFALTLPLSMMLISHLQDIVSDFLRFSQNLGKCALAIELIDATTTISKPLHAPKLSVQDGKIEWQKVCFTYQGAEALFDNISLVIDPQEKVGLVGYSGSGKTTFVNLIMGISPLNSGKILIDGQDISQVDQDSLHEAISFTPQDPILFNRTFGLQRKYYSCC